MLALCDMSTLYLRNVPDDVTERLRRLAEDAGMSVSAFATRELAELSRRADNAGRLGRLRHQKVSASEVVADIADGRRG